MRGTSWERTNALRGGDSYLDDLSHSHMRCLLCSLIPSPPSLPVRLAQRSSFLPRQHTSLLSLLQSVALLSEVEASPALAAINPDTAPDRNGPPQGGITTLLSAITDQVCYRIWGKASAKAHEVHKPSLTLLRWFTTTLNLPLTLLFARPTSSRRSSVASHK